ncbi:MAG: hypothetical protein LBT00_09635 [Spirochaetaceae bacterium]|jgi:hypothetical protein|nr:hypothetical protein [Spirochaetaceae bacterium]
MRRAAGENGKTGVGETIFAQILRLRSVPARLGQPPLGWIRIGSIFFVPIHVFLRVSARLTAPLHGKDGVPASLDSLPKNGVLRSIVVPVNCRLLNSTRPRPSLRASGTLPSEAIQWGDRLVRIASPCSLRNDVGHSLSGTRPKGACSAVLLSPLVAVR